MTDLTSSLKTEYRLNIGSKVLVICILLFIIYKIPLNINEPYLWFDEANQFWISYGQSPEAEADTPQGDLSDFFKYNTMYNLDPGGFGIIFHFWLMVSTHYIWLRILPLLFLAISTFAVFKVAQYFLTDRFNAFLVSLSFLFFPFTYYLGFEVRAYSMELLCTILCIYSLYSFKKQDHILNLFFWSSLIAILMTSRYGAILVAFPYAIIALYQLFRLNHNAIKVFAIKALVFSVPLLISIGYAVFFSFRFQNPNAYMLSYELYIYRDAAEIFAKPYNLIYVFLILGLIPLLWLARQKKDLHRFSNILLLSLLVNIIFLFLSIAGKHPWDVYSWRCISMTTLTLLTYVLIGFFFLEKLSIKKYQINLLMTLIFVGLIVIKDNFEVRKTFKYDYFVNNLDLLLNQNKKIYCDADQMGSIKYLLEYGILNDFKKKGAYNNITFSNSPIHQIGKYEWQKWEQKQPTMNELMDYDVLITPLYFNSNKPHEKDKWKGLDGSHYMWIKKGDTTVFSSKHLDLYLAEYLR